jgi:hypothetical protein
MSLTPLTSRRLLGLLPALLVCAACAPGASTTGDAATVTQSDAGPGGAGQGGQAATGGAGPGGAGQGGGGGLGSPCAVEGDLCSAQLAGAVSLNNPICPEVPDKGWFGYMWESISNCGSQQYTIASGATVWFLMDVSQIPSGYDPPPSPISVQVIDYTEGATGAVINAHVYPLDAADRLTNPDGAKMPSVPAALSCDAECCGTRPLPTDLRYLIQVEEAGAGVPLSLFYGI